MRGRPKETMTPKVEENKAFANWFGPWIAVIQQNRASVERPLPKNPTSADGPQHSDGAHLFGPKLCAASGRHIA